MHRRIPVAVLLLVSVVWSTSCGGRPGNEAVVGSTITIEGNDMLDFVPREIEVDAGRYTIALRNVGGLAHALEIAPVGRSTYIGDTGTVAGHASAEFEIELEPGTYAYVCRVDNHHLAGMVGKLAITG